MTRAPLFSNAERAEQAALWAARLADGLSAGSQQSEFQAWLDADPANGEALDEIVQSWRTVEHYAASGAVVELREAALAHARRTLRRREKAWPRRRVAWASLAATLALAVIGAGVFAWISPRTYQTGVGERRVVALSDGSKLSLDADTVVKVRYTDDKRRLWLERGRARFEVAKNPLRPFSVEAGDELVVATGTAFSVELVKQEVRVVLYEGRVMVLDRDRDGVRRTVGVPGGRAPAEQVLRPGKELILPVAAPTQAAPPPAVIAAIDPVRSLSWEAGQLVFEDEPLDVVVERMNRYADRPLAVGDAATGDVRISGVFSAGDTEALVQGLVTAFSLEARSEAKGVTLYRGRG